METHQGQKRLFFGCEINAPWPDEYPQGRLIAPASRHLTLAFLGNIASEKLFNALHVFPNPLIERVGIFDRCLFLPESHPHVVAWHARFQDQELMGHFSLKLRQWLSTYGYAVDSRPFLSHVTIARAPFNLKEWKHHFAPVPFTINAIHLYESHGNLTYTPLWSYSIEPPFIEFDHAADIAFHIRASSMQQLHLHAEVALAFKYPLLTPYLKNSMLQEELDEIVISLNRLVTIVDSEIGCPFKAVSFHGQVEKNHDSLNWEMIVDV